MWLRTISGDQRTEFVLLKTSLVPTASARGGRGRRRGRRRSIEGTVSPQYQYFEWIAWKWGRGSKIAVAICLAEHLTPCVSVGKCAFSFFTLAPSSVSHRIFESVRDPTFNSNNYCTRLLQWTLTGSNIRWETLLLTLFVFSLILFFLRPPLFCTTVPAPISISSVSMFRALVYCDGQYLIVTFVLSLLWHWMQRQYSYRRAKKGKQIVPDCPWSRLSTLSPSPHVARPGDLSKAQVIYRNCDSDLCHLTL